MPGSAPPPLAPPVPPDRRALEVLAPEGQDKAVRDARKAGTILIVLGILNVLAGLAFLGNPGMLDEYLEEHGRELTMSGQMLGTLNVLFGGAALASGAGVRRLSSAWRVVGIVVAGLAVLLQFWTLLSLGNGFSGVGALFWIWAVTLLARSQAAFQPVATLDAPSLPGAAPSLQPIPPPAPPAALPVEPPPLGEVVPVSRMAMTSQPIPDDVGVPQVSAGESPQIVDETCPQCGVARRADAQFCGSCGRSFASADSAVPVTGQVAQPPPLPPVATPAVIPAPSAQVVPAPPVAADSGPVSPTGRRRWLIAVGLVGLAIAAGVGTALVIGSGDDEARGTAATPTQEDDQDEVSTSEPIDASDDAIDDTSIESDEELSTVAGSLIVTDVSIHQHCAPEVDCGDYPPGSDFVIVFLARADGEGFEEPLDLLLDEALTTTLSSEPARSVSADKASVTTIEAETSEMFITFLWPEAPPDAFEFTWPGNEPVSL